MRYRYPAARWLLRDAVVRRCCCPSLAVAVRGVSFLCNAQVLYSETVVKGNGTMYNLIQALLSFCGRLAISHLCIVDGVPVPADKLKDDADVRSCSAPAVGPSCRLPGQQHAHAVAT